MYIIIVQSTVDMNLCILDSLWDTYLCGQRNPIHSRGASLMTQCSRICIHYCIPNTFHMYSLQGGTVWCTSALLCVLEGERALFALPANYSLAGFERLFACIVHVDLTRKHVPTYKRSTCPHAYTVRSVSGCPHIHQNTMYGLRWHNF